MVEIGNLSEELYIRFRNNIYLQNGNSGIINVLNPDGSLNVKVKDIINYSSPFNSQENGFYYYDKTLYLKNDDNIINLQENSSLPKGAIIMYNENTSPNGFNLYSQDSKFNNVINIIKN